MFPSIEPRMRGASRMAAADDIDRDSAGEPPSLVRAAQYVRMSTDHQRYSTENQAEAIHHYADDHGMQIVRTYPSSAGTVGEAAVWGGSRTVAGMAANPSGAR
jgi:hypothetical protein